jgi:Ca-activated chloride channel family protein
MIFANINWLFALLLLPLLVVIEGFVTRYDRARIVRLVSRALWDRVLLRPWPYWRWIRLTLMLMGALGLILALARPQWGVVREKIEREGVDIIMVLDTSGSMATEDVSPNRFFLARAALRSLLARLEGDRFGLLAFSGEAYPLVPLTFDADAIGLFLDTIEIGVVPPSGSSLGVGMAKAMEMFVDRERKNKALILVSDGEDLEGEIENAIGKAKEVGVVVHTVGVGSEKGGPVPNQNAQGNRSGFKKEEDGSVVISRLQQNTLERIARETAGRYFHISGADSDMDLLAFAIESMEQKLVAREYSYKRKERFQIPLAFSFICFTLALILPLPTLSKRRSGRTAIHTKGAMLIGLILSIVGPIQVGEAQVLNEILLRPHRFTSLGQEQFKVGNHKEALRTFESAARMRPNDPVSQFNLANAFYKNERFEEAEKLYQGLEEDARSPLAVATRFNLGNTFFKKQDYASAIRAYRSALHLAPNDQEIKKNMELALRAIEKQKKDQEQNKGQKEPDASKESSQKKQSTPNQGQGQKDNASQKASPPKSEAQKEQERFQKEAGLSREQAMRLLDALQQNEKEEQRRLLEANQTGRQRRRKDW